MFVLVQVSSRKTGRLTSSSGCRAIHCRRASATSGRLCSAARSDFFLGWQRWLAGLPLQGGEIGVGITTEAGSQGSRVTPSVEALAEMFPAVLADAAQIAGGG